jgi:hypothetical protein
MSVTNFRRASLQNGFPKSSDFADIAGPPPPSTIPTSSLELWLRPENISASAGLVNGYTDASPAGRSITAASGYVPAVSTVYLNGYSGSYFPGSVAIKWFDYTTDIWDIGSGLNASTVTAVFYPDLAQGGNYGSFVSQGGGGKTSVLCCPQSYPNASIQWATDNYANGGRRTVGTSALNQWYKVTWTWSDWQTRSTTKIYLSNVEQSSQDWNGAPNPVAGGNRYIGRALDFGVDAITSGTLMELLVWRRVLSSNELADVNNVLNTKYGL